MAEADLECPGARCCHCSFRALCHWVVLLFKVLLLKVPHLAVLPEVTQEHYGYYLRSVMLFSNAPELGEAILVQGLQTANAEDPWL